MDLYLAHMLAKHQKRPILFRGNLSTTRLFKIRIQVPSTDFSTSEGPLENRRLVEAPSFGSRNLR